VGTFFSTKVKTLFSCS